MNYLSTFAFYDAKGRRLSIFGKRIGDGIQIVVIPCSKKDQFCKVTGRALYEAINDETCNYETHNVVIKNGRYKKTFIDWCKTRYNKMLEVSLPDAIGKQKSHKYFGKKLPAVVFQ